MSRRLGLFEGFGIEIEYMIVDQESLDVLPISDRIIGDAAGAFVNEVERDKLAWSNELALHVIEMKTNGPAANLTSLPALFQGGVGEIDSIAARWGGRLMPGAMHPWMDPDRETRLWPHEYNPIYEAYDRIFDCRGHGWSNLQSMHVNLPFNGEEEFVRLHAAIRMVLPILPMLAASSPFADGRRQGSLDHRMQVYRGNARRIPSIAGHIVPEPVIGIEDYHRRILAPMYADITPHDPEGILREEWLNSRGAIARFDRDAIEIRVLDSQECPLADIAVAAAAVEAVRALSREDHAAVSTLQAIDTARLARLFLAAIEAGEDAVIDDKGYLAVFGCERSGDLSGRQLWARLMERSPPDAGTLHRPLEHYLRYGSLASRLVRAVGENPNHEQLAEVYGDLCDCLSTGSLFSPTPG